MSDLNLSSAQISQIKKILWIITVVGSVLGGLMALIGIFASKSAPQEAAAAAMGLALAVIPYCLARAVSEMKQE
ncbi:MAG: hypothetical protein LBE50_06775 [Gallionellaceae bacterium]|jgi:magnesium-transporting ATPase (P-type)|nr:hypothetical protein [Gallionellaceae bacterium]